MASTNHGLGEDWYFHNLKKWKAKIYYYKHNHSDIEVKVRLERPYNKYTYKFTCGELVLNCCDGLREHEMEYLCNKYEMMIDNAYHTNGATVSFCKICDKGFQGFILEHFFTNHRGMIKSANKT